ncbi:hypothetical protein, partial [Rhizobium leguminosarum]|uniref:hypothetical protein n=1 Tax=Rhizobium leguminosarum TaxID=384 RepID=UPI0019D4D1AB
TSILHSAGSFFITKLASEAWHRQAPWNSASGAPHYAHLPRRSLSLRIRQKQISKTVRSGGGFVRFWSQAIKALHFQPVTKMSKNFGWVC